MKKNHQFLFFVLFLIGFFSIIPNFLSVKAQGTCQVVSEMPAAWKSCELKANNCSAGYYPVVKVVVMPEGRFCQCECIAEGTTPSPHPATTIIPNPPTSGIQPTECDSNNDGTNDGIQTALGCIPTKDTTQFVGWLLGALIKIAGGIAFLLIIFGAIKVLTSSGNPEAVKAGQEMITSALMGLLFIIFSLFLLELIGVKILHIPGFGQ
jgi:hypothetical protein